MISYTCQTAVKAVIYIATKHQHDVKSCVKEIAQHIGASKHSVGKMLQTLVKRNIINSTKGPTGGFYFTTAQKTIAYKNHGSYRWPRCV